MWIGVRAEPRGPHVHRGDVPGAASNGAIPGGQPLLPVLDTAAPVNRPQRGGGSEALARETTRFRGASVRLPGARCRTPPSTGRRQPRASDCRRCTRPRQGAILRPRPPCSNHRRRAALGHGKLKISIISKKYLPFEFRNEK